MNKWIIAIYTAFLIVLLASPGYSQTIPPNILEFTGDYYDVLGEPELSASILGNPEYDTAEASRIYVKLVNSGLLSGFETVNSPDQSDIDGVANAQTELNLEHEATTAISIQGALENNNNAPVKITSGLQPGGSLRSGEVSQPLEFDVEIYKNAPEGTYELTLNLTYRYQYDVQVKGSKDMPKIDYWYTSKHQALPIMIRVKPGAVFEIVNVSADLRPGQEGIVSITYKNVGNQPAYESVAGISVIDPISTTDDGAFLGTLVPGDSYRAIYLIKINEDALPRNYWIDTEVRFKDEHGNTRITDTQKAEVIVQAPVRFGNIFSSAGFMIAAGILAGIVGAAVLFIYRGKKSGKSFRP